MADRKRTDPLDWDDLRFFAELAAQGSLSGAARKLGVNHATVSRRLASLEAALGGSLFDRRPEGYIPNARGAAVLEQARVMDGAAIEIRRLFDADTQVQGTVRLTATRALAEVFILPRLAGFARAWPGLSIELVAADRLLSLPRREADIAVRVGRPTRGDAVLTRKVARLEWRLFATPGYLADHRPDAFGFIGYEARDAVQPEAKVIEALGGGRRIRFRADSLPAQREAALAGFGIALLPSYLAAGSGLVAVPGFEPSWRDICLLVRRDLARVPRVRLLYDHLAALFRDEAELLAGGSAGTEKKPPEASGGPSL